MVLPDLTTLPQAADAQLPRAKSYRELFGVFYLLRPASAQPQHIALRPNVWPREKRHTNLWLDTGRTGSCSWDVTDTCAQFDTAYKVLLYPNTHDCTSTVIKFGIILF